MRKPMQARNKLIVLARQANEIKTDNDFSWRSLGKTLDIKAPTVVEIYKHSKDKYDFSDVLKAKKPKKLSTD